LVPVKRAALGFFAGVRAVLGGVGFVVSRPSVWPLAAVPVLVAMVVFGGLLFGVAYVADHVAGSLASTSAGFGFSTAEYWGVHLALWIVGVVVSFVLAMSLAQPLSGPALEAIARRQELALGGKAWPNQPFLRGIGRSIGVTVTALAIGLPVLGVLSLITLMFPPLSVVTVPLKFLVTGLLAAYDLLDYPFSVRGRGVGERIVFVREQVWAVLGFGVTIAALLLIPLVGLFILPFGVAGATRLLVERDGKPLAVPRG
jgi:CysZ protein